MDEADRAQAAEERDRAIALQVALARMPPKVARTTSDTACAECGEAIEPERLRVLADTERCASCAHEHARTTRLYAWKR